MDSPPYVPYQAYKPKRHSRGVSNQNQHLVPNVSPPPQSRPPSTLGNGHAFSEPRVPQHAQHTDSADVDRRPFRTPNGTSMSRPASMFAAAPQYELPVNTTIVRDSSPTTGPASPTDGGSSSAPSSIRTESPPHVHESSGTETKVQAPNGKNVERSQPTPGPSTPLSSEPSSERPTQVPRKSSTFKHVPLRPQNARPPHPSSPLRPAGNHSRTPSSVSTSSRQLDYHPHNESSHTLSNPTTPPLGARDRSLPAVPPSELLHNHNVAIPRSDVHSPQPHLAITTNATGPIQRSSSLAAPTPPQSQTPSSLPTSPGPTPSPAPSSVSLSTNRASARPPAPYRPGFQPKGVYRPRTDEFIAARKASRNEGRIERTRLERRLEKLINLHFPHPSLQKESEKATLPVVRPRQMNKRLSSIFDLDLSDLRSKSAGDLWRDVLQSQAPHNAKADIRAAEQTITPWEDDAAVSQCPLCSASFHPLTNRKHHCRLCGRIVCSLPVKYPQRPVTCSLLFYADPKTGKIEEVSEGVDYGVRRRSTMNSPGKTKGKEDVLSDEEKFLKGVRICRDCRPVLLRQQYQQEVYNTPPFVKLYEAFISVEKEIENALPRFQELMLTLSKHEHPTPEASAARKRLLEAFAQYDTLSKRLRQLPCPAGSSQERIQAAMATRANLFLQKHMFPLQALPKPKSSNASSPAVEAEPEGQFIDPDSEVARALQPLLEQEALLESFVEEAKAHRKFEDAKTLKANLREIRSEIDRILTNAEGGMTEQGKHKGKAKARGA